MNKRLILAIAISFLIMLVWSRLSQKFYPIEPQGVTEKIPSLTPTPASTSTPTPILFEQEQNETLLSTISQGRELVFNLPSASLTKVIFSQFNDYSFDLRQGFYLGGQNLIFTLENDNGIGVSVKTATALGRLKDSTAVEPLINFLQKSQSVESRRAITYALAEIGDKRAAEVFIELLEDEDETVRYWSCLSLGFMQYKKAVNTLLDVLKEDESVRVRKTAALSVGQLVPKTKKCVQVLLETLETESNLEVQEKIKNTLERIAKNQGYKNEKEMIKEMGLKK